VAVAVVLALASFILHHGLERRLDHLQVFEQYNIVFQADPNERINAMSHGWGSSGRNFAHPNLAAFTSPFVRAIAAVATRAGLATDEEALRRSIGLLIVPLASAVSAVLLYALLLRLGSSIALASLFTVLGMVSFSPVVFGSIPDHFALSVPVITVAYHLFLSATRERVVRWRLWAITMFITAGITVTNMVIIAILMAGAMWAGGRGRVRSALQVASMVAGVALLTYAGSFAVHQVILGKSLDAHSSRRWATTFINDSDFLRRLVRFPAAMANTIAPARISTGGPTPSYRPADRYQFRFTFEDGPGWPTARNLPGLISLALVAAGVVVSVRRRVALSPVGVASAAVVAFNWLLHSAWGDETFLYSQHWFASMLVLMALAVASVKRPPRITTWIVGVFTVAVAANSLALVSTMLTILRSKSG
jgi:hypothetical protein